MTPAQFAALCPDAERANEWVVSLNEAAEEFEITPGLRFINWLAQCCHECGGFTVFEENLNYDARGMANTWPVRFSETGRAGGKPSVLALSLHRKPEAIANSVYANRMGNSAPASGDGWRYRGRGPIQITGKDMYERCGLFLGIDLLHAPSSLFVPTYGARSAAWLFVQEKRCLPLCDEDDIRGVTKRVNGGEIGLDDRIKWRDRIKTVMAAA